MEKLRKNTKENGKKKFNGTPKPITIYGVLPKGGTKLRINFGGKI
jgi:hypothetical protein